MSDKKRDELVDGKRLSQLKVTELRLEIDKRGLKRGGNKREMIDRLQSALTSEKRLSEDQISESQLTKSSTEHHCDDKDITNEKYTEIRKSSIDGHSVDVGDATSYAPEKMVAADSRGVSEIKDLAVPSCPETYTSDVVVDIKGSGGGDAMSSLKTEDMASNDKLGRGDKEGVLEREAGEIVDEVSDHPTEDTPLVSVSNKRGLYRDEDVHDSEVAVVTVVRESNNTIRKPLARGKPFHIASDNNSGDVCPGKFEVVKDSSSLQKNYLSEGVDNESVTVRVSEDFIGHADKTAKQKDNLTPKVEDDPGMIDISMSADVDLDFDKPPNKKYDSPIQLKKSKGGFECRSDTSIPKRSKGEFDPRKEISTPNNTLHLNKSTGEFQKPAETTESPVCSTSFDRLTPCDPKPRRISLKRKSSPVALPVIDKLLKSSEKSTPKVESDILSPKSPTLPEQFTVETPREVKIKPRKISLKSATKTESKKPKWSQVRSSAPTISTVSLKEIILTKDTETKETMDVEDDAEKIIEVPVIQMEDIEITQSVNEDLSSHEVPKPHQEIEFDKPDELDYSEDERPQEETKTPVRQPVTLPNLESLQEPVPVESPALKKKLTVRRLTLEEEPLIRDKTVPPPLNCPRSDIIHVMNLVRPFTESQLKSLLSRKGQLTEDGFWIDKIKRHCYAKYHSKSEAEQMRNLLHGVIWPSSNPNYLIVEFVTKYDMDLHARPEEAKRQVDRWNHDKFNVDDEQRGKGKREPDNDALRHNRREDRRPRENEEKLKRRKQLDDRTKREEKPPAKVLDDLFKKTKQEPVIYWMELSEKESEVKDKVRQEKEVERTKRRAQIEKEIREQEALAMRSKRRSTSRGRSGDQNRNRVDHYRPRSGEHYDNRNRRRYNRR